MTASGYCKVLLASLVIISYHATGCIAFFSIIVYLTLYVPPARGALLLILILNA